MGDSGSVEHEAGVCGLPPVDARVRLILGAAALGVVVASGNVVVPATLAAASAAACLASGLPPRRLAARLALPGAIALAAALARLPWPGGRVLVALPVGPWAVEVTEFGLHAGALAGARVLATVAVVLAATAGVSAAHLLAAARWLRAPATLVELASLMYRYLFLLREETRTVVRAQVMRLGYAGGLRSVRCGAAAGAVSFLRACERAGTIHHAMLLRGYRGDLPGESLPPLGRRQLAYVGAGLVLLAGVFVAGAGSY